VVYGKRGGYQSDVNPREDGHYHSVGDSLFSSVGNFTGNGSTYVMTRSPSNLYRASYAGVWIANEFGGLDLMLGINGNDEKII
jgi:hypothetical protein